MSVQTEGDRRWFGKVVIGGALSLPTLLSLKLRAAEAPITEPLKLTPSANEQLLEGYLQTHTTPSSLKTSTPDITSYQLVHNRPQPIKPETRPFQHTVEPEKQDEFTHKDFDDIFDTLFPVAMAISGVEDPGEEQGKRFDGKATFPGRNHTDVFLVKGATTEFSEKLPKDRIDDVVKLREVRQIIIAAGLDDIPVYPGRREYYSVTTYTTIDDYLPRLRDSTGYSGVNEGQSESLRLFREATPAELQGIFVATLEDFMKHRYKNFPRATNTENFKA